MADVYVVLVSDHGMLRIDPERVQVLDMEELPGVRLVTSGPYVSLRVEEGGPERAVQVRDAVRAMLPGCDVWLREEVPERFHYSSDPRIGDVVVLAEPGGMVLPATWRGSLSEPYSHGWDNQTPEMGAIFLAKGPGITGGTRLAPFEAVHIYPFLAHVLGLKPNPDIDGDLEVLRPILSGGG